ncbi:hypothetical protein SAMN05421858_2949 [Haladaptatus litoreus]|uniref:Uncharacterized protein n=1 Tax=Haladaptatus litoreus TaxID=553468 RepID=A0A1N7C404_9EURY|nr:hypothetical protein SAMN05421858_2949 [Haladaptatus litoreus]
MQQFVTLSTVTSETFIRAERIVVDDTMESVTASETVSAVSTGNRNGRSVEYDRPMEYGRPMESR